MVVVSIQTVVYVQVVNIAHFHQSGVWENIAPHRTNAKQLTTNVVCELESNTWVTYQVARCGGNRNVAEIIIRAPPDCVLGACHVGERPREWLLESRESCTH